MNYQRLPKAVLHEHLDGGLRASTVMNLATVRLPASTESALVEWFDQEGVNSLERYLETFAVTVSAMQTEPNISQVAYESVIDLAADGVRYAEIRFAPSLATDAGLTLEEVIAAACKGLAAAESQHPIVVRLIVDAMRQENDSSTVVDAALRVQTPYVVGFDLAGPEAGYPASKHRRACDMALEAGLGLTIHAGEGDGVESIADALDCGAQRIGHGVRIAEDCRIEAGTIVDVGPVAQRILDNAIPLELCPTSNRHTLGMGIYKHPIDALRRAGFAVTVNTDNRLMSRTSMSNEFRQLADAFGWDEATFANVTQTAIASAFIDDPTKQALLADWDDAS